MAQTHYSSERRKVKVAEGVRLYTGTGHAPFKEGRLVTLDGAHADALIKTGHVTDPEADKAKAAKLEAEKAAEAEHAPEATVKATPEAPAGQAHDAAAQAAPAPAAAAPAPHPVTARPGGPGVGPTQAR